MQAEVHGAYLIMGHRIRLKFTCPACRHRHTEFVNSQDEAPEYVDVTAKCGQTIRVRPYRRLK